MKSYLFGLSGAALIAIAGCSASTGSPSGGGGSAGSGGGSGYSCYAIVNQDGGAMGCGMLTYSAGVSGGCGGATPTAGVCPSADLAGCCVGSPQVVGGTQDTVQTVTCFYGGASVATMAKAICTQSWQTTVP